MKTTANYKILNYLKYRDWTSSVSLERMGQQWGIKDSIVSRRCRELTRPTQTRPAQLDRRLNSHGVVEYRHKNAKPVTFTPEQEQIR